MIQTKRDSLEKFIREQMLGPGACLDHYSIKKEDATEGDSVEEVLNTTPGSVYSTGVLFPQRKLAESTDVQESDSQSEIVFDSADDSDDDNQGEGFEEIMNRSQSDDEDLFSLSQRFPTTIGLSFCIEKETPLSAEDLSIYISGRYYRKVLKENCTSIIINIEEQNSFERLFTEYSSELAPYFSYSDKQLHITHNFEKEVGTVKDLLNSINQKLCKNVAFNEDGTLDKEYTEIGETYRFLKSYKERLWRKLMAVKNGMYPAAREVDVVLSRIKNVEVAETFISYLEDAMNICNAKSFGYWACESFSVPVDLSSIDMNASGAKVIYSPKKNSSLKDVVEFPVDANGTSASLSVWIQILNAKSADKKKKYIKVQLENTSTPLFQEDEDHYFSIVTEKVNQRSFFGVEIKVSSPLLAPYKDVKSKNTQSDVEALNYLYRSIDDYGVGHLCSVDWNISGDNRWVKTEFIPSYETPDVEAVPRDKNEYVECDHELVPKPLLDTSETLQFKWLSTFSEATNQDVITGLYKFIDAYQSWIDKLKVDVSTQSEHDKILGNANINECLKDCNRMRDNVKILLDGNDYNITSFRIMNSAMFIQLWHSKFNNEKKTNIDFYKEATDHIFGDFPATWRPFQLAFILLNLDGIIQRPDDPRWDYRNELVDLVWFPTGGGKTEAYLGIIALTIIHRRRTEHCSGGTTAIMRYTLRLLATQQFQRAMRVILALELLRRWDKYGLGEEPISIGLYVGDNSLPNKAVDLREECLKWNDLNPDGKRKESKIPLDKCPCCGKPLKYINRGSDSAPEIKFRCDNVRCNFSNEIPVKLCDEYIYKEPPTLLFGTVDKFAAIGHRVSSKPNKENQDSRRIFGKGLNNLPPSLIIQDELHLLLGPLGSAVSLFECAIDQLCTYEKNINGSSLKIRPKIISSTATTRNTELQIRALYDRSVSIFPKSGIDYDDSFFSFYQRKKTSIDVHESFVSKRKYIGILPTGRTQMTTQMRLVATMFVHRAIFERQYKARLHDKDVETAFDYYHSLVSKENF